MERVPTMNCDGWDILLQDILTPQAEEARLKEKLKRLWDDVPIDGGPTA